AARARAGVLACRATRARPLARAGATEPRGLRDRAALGLRLRVGEQRRDGQRLVLGRDPRAELRALRRGRPRPRPRGSLLPDAHLDRPGTLVAAAALRRRLGLAQASRQPLDAARAVVVRSELRVLVPRGDEAAGLPAAELPGDRAAD